MTCICLCLRVGRRDLSLTENVDYDPPVGTHIRIDVDLIAANDGLIDGWLTVLDELEFFARAAHFL